MKHTLIIATMIAVLTLSLSPTFANEIPLKGTEGPDIRAKVEPRGIEGPDVRLVAKTKPKGVEGPDVR